MLLIRKYGRSHFSVDSRHGVEAVLRAHRYCLRQSRGNQIAFVFNKIFIQFKAVIPLKWHRTHLFLNVAMALLAGRQSHVYISQSVMNFFFSNMTHHGSSGHLRFMMHDDVCFQSTQSRKKWIYLASTLCRLLKSNLQSGTQARLWC